MPAPHLAVLRHVRWEGPHRILDAFGDFEVTEIDVLDQPALLPVHGSLAGAIVMGGPMSVHDTDRHPALRPELAWIESALECGLPLLGICLGSQLIAKALGAEVRPAPRKELGWAPVEITAPDDPLLGPLAPSTVALHWHGEEFDPPPGAQVLARSEQTPCQAFRSGPAWGVLFHPEADMLLLHTWLDAHEMHDEADQELGHEGPQHLLDEASRYEPELIERSRRGFEAFAQTCREFVT